MKYRSKVFTIRPGGATTGGAGSPTEVLGVDVQRVILTRADRPAALVLLVDQRYAITGNVLAVGDARDMADYASGRALRCRSRSDRHWHRECAKALAAAHPRVGGRFVASISSSASGG